jgi:hypothetical protein
LAFEGWQTRSPCYPVSVKVILTAGLGMGSYYLELAGISKKLGVTVGGSVFVSDPVPEPATWAMLIVGFAGVAFLGMRSRRGSRYAV